MHSSQTRDRYGVQPWEYVSREELVDKHARECDPEPPEWLGVLDSLPMETLEHLHRGKTAPVNRINVPNADGTHYTTNTIAEESNRDGAEDNSDGTQRHIVEEVGCREDLTARSCDRRRGCSD